MLYLEGSLQEFTATPFASRKWKPEFDEILKELSLGSEPKWSWDHLKEIIRFKLLKNIQQLFHQESSTPPPGEESLDSYEDRIFNALEDLNGYPFTLQRLSELCLNPEGQHPNVWKYLRALEKVLLVTSLLEPSQSALESQESSSEAKVAGKEPLSGKEELSEPQGVMSPRQDDPMETD